MELRLSDQLIGRCLSENCKYSTPRYMIGEAFARGYYGSHIVETGHVISVEPAVIDDGS
jgi:hypothetical protein